VERYSTLGQVSEAWRNLAKIHHPDKGGSEKEMIKINTAWQEAKNEIMSR
jgi:molecular chaperone DnaJ